MNRCGTVRGYFDHRAVGEKTCADCRAAKRAYQIERSADYGTCSVPQCSEPVEARAWCSSHLDKWRRWGTPTPSKPSAHARFWSRVNEAAIPDYAPHLGPCWTWAGKRTSQGYGSFGTDQTLAHRYAYEDMVAEIPEDLTIDHLCRVRLCVNPSHLEPVTRAENTRRELEARKAS